ncbi:MAG: regulatory protein RecX [Proteobacteria bacterium]|nr:regulatory protein RecX [Pseudomonadota bacterium]
MPAASGRSLKARALQWLAQREHSRVELRRKLLRAARDAAAKAEAGTGAGAAADGAGRASADDDGEAAADVQARVDALLDWLEAGRYLSPERFVESRVHARAARYGNLRIRRELQQHDLAVDAQTAATLAATELDRARAVRARRYPAPPGDANERARQARFLIGRGFSSEVVRRVLGEAGTPDDAASAD